MFINQKVNFVTITENNVGQRIDNFLVTYLKGLPKSRIYRILRKGEVRVNKGRAKPDTRLQEGDIVRIPPLRLTPVEEFTVKPSRGVQQTLGACILFEDDNLLIVNKPAGMAVHGGSGVDFGVIEILRFMRPEAKLLELAHRLDRDTSGCLLIAKKANVLKELHALFREGQMEKVYMALVQGRWPKRLQHVSVSLRKYQLQSGERLVSVDHEEGKEALTVFQLMECFSNASLIEARPKTGRTHQIRVHTKHAGHPIVGDPKYGDKELDKPLRALGCKRLFLHALALNFVLPSTGQKITVKAEMDAEWQACLVKLRQL